MKKLLFVFCLMASVALAEQQVLVVACKDGSPDTARLSKMLNQGWKVVTATPVQDSDSMGIGKPKQSYTVTIVYVLEKP